MRVREVGYGSDDSEASWLIYVTIWQLLRRKGRSRKTGSWPIREENKYQRPRRHCSTISLVLRVSFSFRNSEVLGRYKIKKGKQITTVECILENEIIELCTIYRKD